MKFPCLKSITIYFMKSLWHALLAHREVELVQTQQLNIFNSLVSALSNPQWKDREAAALALEAFLPQVNFLPIYICNFHVRK